MSDDKIEPEWAVKSVRGSAAMLVSLCDETERLRVEHERLSHALLGRDTTIARFETSLNEAQALEQRLRVQLDKAHAEAALYRDAYDKRADAAKQKPTREALYIVRQGLVPERGLYMDSAGNWTARASESTHSRTGRKRRIVLRRPRRPPAQGAVVSDDTMPPDVTAASQAHLVATIQMLAREIAAARRVDREAPRRVAEGARP